MSNYSLEEFRSHRQSVSCIGEHVEGMEGDTTPGFLYPNGFFILQRTTALGEAFVVIDGSAEIVASDLRVAERILWHDVAHYGQDERAVDKLSTADLLDELSRRADDSPSRVIDGALELLARQDLAVLYTDSVSRLAAEWETDANTICRALPRLRGAMSHSSASEAAGDILLRLLQPDNE